MPSFKPVTAVTRGLDVLAAVNRLGEASVGQIGKLVDLSPPTIVRMLETLQHAGYVVKHPERAIYLPTGRTMALSLGFAPHRELAAVAGPILAQLNGEVGWPSDLAVYDGAAMLVITTSRGDGRMSFNRRPGYRAPLFATSLGMSYLAFCDPRERAEALVRAAGSAEPWDDIAGEPDRAAAAFATVRTQGYATMHDAYCQREYGGRLWAVGTPVLLEGRPVGALNMMLVRAAVSSDAELRRFVTPLQRAAKAIARALLAARAGGTAPAA